MAWGIHPRFKLEVVASINSEHVTEMLLDEVIYNVNLEMTVAKALEGKMMTATFSRFMKWFKLVVTAIFAGGFG